MASLQQAIQKGMPPDQAVQYVKSMATQGVAPMADLYAMMNQFQRLKQQQVQPPQTPPTIRDQLNIMDQQQQMQGIQQMQAPAPAPQPMDRGLGAIDAGRMEYPQFAGGGIVAFQAGGTSASNATPATEDVDIVTFVKRRMPNFDTLTPEQKQQVLRSFEPMYMQARQRLLGTNISANENTSSPFANFDQMATFARQGVRQDIVPLVNTRQSIQATIPAPPRAPAAKDPFTDLITAERGRKFESVPDTFSGEEKARVEKALSDLGAERKDAARMALAQAGFGMAAAAARAGRQRTTALGALAEGAMGGMQQYAAAQKEIRQTERDLNKEMGMLRRYQDEVARGERTAQRAFEEKRADNIANLTAKSEQLKLNQAELAQQLKIANIRATGNERLADQLMGMYDAYDKETDPAKREQLKQAFESRLAASERIIRSTTAGGVGTGTKEANAILNAVETAKEGNEYRMADRAYNAAVRSGDTAEIQRADAARQQILMKARRDAESVLGISGSSGYVPTLGGGAYRGPYAGFSAELIG